MPVASALELAMTAQSELVVAVQVLDAMTADRVALAVPLVAAITTRFLSVVTLPVVVSAPTVGSTLDAKDEMTRVRHCVSVVLLSAPPSMVAM